LQLGENRSLNFNIRMGDKPPRPYQVKPLIDLPDNGAEAIDHPDGARADNDKWFGEHENQDHDNRSEDLSKVA
jgi:hypothetical protein